MLSNWHHANYNIFYQQDTNSISLKIDEILPLAFLSTFEYGIFTLIRVGTSSLAGIRQKRPYN